MKFTDALKAEYLRMYSHQVIPDKRTGQVYGAIAKISVGKSRYQAVEASTKVPWFVIGIIHLLECDSRFDCHLHNGDPLTARTVDVPRGRPKVGTPPFTWEASAVDALQYAELSTWKDWSIPGTLYKLEGYNGWGSRNHGIAPHYLWGGTKFYNRGNYISDGIWSPAAVSLQIGAAPILYTMDQQKLIDFPTVEGLGNQDSMQGLNTGVAGSSLEPPTNSGVI